MKKIFLITDSYGTIIEARETKAQATKRAKELTNEEKGILYSALPANLCGVYVHGLLWFDKVNGNTYHAGSVTLFFDNGKKLVLAIPYQYGYGSQYEQSAAEEMDKAGFLPDLKKYPSGGSESLWTYFERNNVGYRSTSNHVSTKKEIK